LKHRAPLLAWPRSLPSTPSSDVPISLPEFFSLPLVERIQLSLRQKMRFYDERANLIPLPDGLKLLREQVPG
jgi:hypothetical protein